MTKPWTEHLWAQTALWAALATVLLAVIRIFAWTGFNIPVALAVLGVTDRATVLGATLLLVLQVALPQVLLAIWLFSPVTIVGLFRPKWKNPWSAVGNYAAVLGMFFIIGWAVPSIYLLTDVALTLIIATGVLILVAWVKQHARRKAMSTDAALEESGDVSAAEAGPTIPKIRTLTINAVLSDGRGQLVGLIPLTLGIVQLLFSVIWLPWLPSESVTVAGMAEPAVGYVVGQQGDFTLLVNRDQDPIWVESTDIKRRVICAVAATEWTQRTLAELFNPHFLPLCSSAR